MTTTTIRKTSLDAFEKNQHSVNHDKHMNANIILLCLTPSLFASVLKAPNTDYSGSMSFFSFLFFSSPSFLYQVLIGCEGTRPVHMSEHLISHVTCEFTLYGKEKLPILISVKRRLKRCPSTSDGARSVQKTNDDLIQLDTAK